MVVACLLDISLPPTQQISIYLPPRPAITPSFSYHSSVSLSFALDQLNPPFDVPMSLTSSDRFSTDSFVSDTAD